MIGCVLRSAAALVSLLTLVACGEKQQTIDTGARRSSDAPAWSVSDAAEPAFAAPGWKAGDKAAWEEQIRKRNQAQNDYVR